MFRRCCVFIAAGEFSAHGAVVAAPDSGLCDVLTWSVKSRSRMYIALRRRNPYNKRTATLILVSPGQLLRGSKYVLISQTSYNRLMLYSVIITSLFKLTEWCQPKVVSRDTLLFSVSQCRTIFAWFALSLSIAFLLCLKQNWQVYQESDTHLETTFLHLWRIIVRRSDI